jgi:hypothetical protein
MEAAQVTTICINTFARHFNIAVESIQIDQVKEQLIDLEPPLEPDQVSAQILSKCLVHKTHSPIGYYKIYMRTNGNGNVYWAAL